MIKLRKNKLNHEAILSRNIMDNFIMKIVKKYNKNINDELDEITTNDILDDIHMEIFELEQATLSIQDSNFVEKIKAKNII
jgi:hypothetical protein